VSGFGTLVKMGANTLSLGVSGTAPTASNTFSNGILVLGGNLQAVATGTNNATVTFNALGGNAITLSNGAWRKPETLGETLWQKTGTRTLVAVQ
jgi:hypothetical protein